MLSSTLAMKEIVVLATVLVAIRVDSYNVRLSKEASGQRILKSTHGTYLRAWEGADSDKAPYVDMAPHIGECEQWIIEDHKGQVALKPYCYKSLYLRTDQNNSLSLSYGVQLWIPFENRDETWSFLSEHLTFLTANNSGTVCAAKINHYSWENFKLEPWPEANIDSTSHSLSQTMPTNSSEQQFESEEPLGDYSYVNSDDGVSMSFYQSQVNTNANLSAEVAGHYSIKSAHNDNVQSHYLRGWRGHFGEMSEWKVDWATYTRTCENWIIEDRSGTVVIRSRCSNDLPYLSANSDSSVVLSATEQKWSPAKNGDGSWSFLSPHGEWLAADEKFDRAFTSISRASMMDFLLEAWTDHESGIIRQSASPHEQIFPKMPNLSEESKSGSVADEDVKKDLSVLSDKVAGLHLLSSTIAADSYLGVSNKDGEWNIETCSPLNDCDLWFIDDHYGKVSLRPYCASSKYLRAHHRGIVDLADSQGDHEMWTPHENGDGTWSFQSFHGGWLKELPQRMSFMGTKDEISTKFKIIRELSTTTSTATTTSTELTTTRVRSTTYRTPPSTSLANTQLIQTAPNDTFHFKPLLIIVPIFVIFAVILAVFAVILAIAKKKKLEVSISYRNLVYDDQHP